MRTGHQCWSFAAMFCLTLIAQAAAAAEAPVWTVANASANLSARPLEEGRWRSLAYGDKLPARFELRTLFTRLSSVRRGDDRLDLASGTQCVVDGDTIRLLEGDVYFERGAATRWTFAVGATTIRPADDTTFQVERRAGATVPRILVTAGSVIVEHEDRQLAIGAGQVSVDVNDQPLTAGPATDEQIATWTRWRTPTAQQGLGQLVVDDVQAGSARRLNIARYHVNVVLQPPMALVQIDQSFYNPFDRQEEGTFAFSLPPGASVSRFAMYVTHAQLIEGELLERGRAGQIYDAIVRGRRDPAILEEIGPNQFRMKVFPIFARDTKRVLLDFTVPLESLDDRYHFRLPLMSDRDPIADFRLRGTIHGADVGSVASPTHDDLKIRPARNSASHEFDMARSAYKPDSDFALTFTSNTPQNQVRRYVASPLEKQDGTYSYFMTTLAPPNPNVKLTAPADVVLLVDTSEAVVNRRDVKMLARNIARNLPASAKFQLACVDATFRKLTSDWVAPDSPAALAALARLDDELFLGRRLLAKTLPQSLAAFRETPELRRRIVIYVGPGPLYRSLAQTREAEDEITENLRLANASLVGVHVDEDEEARRALERLVEAAGGIAFDCEQARGRARLSRWLLTGLPNPLRIESANVAGVIEGDLFTPPRTLPGEPVHVVGRIKGDLTRFAATAPDNAFDDTPLPADEREDDADDAQGARNAPPELHVRFAGDKEARIVRLQGPAPEDDLFVGRLWAQRKLQHIRESLPASFWFDKAVPNEPERLASARTEVVGLSLEWSLLTPFTAFLVLESDADYQRWKVERGARRRYWLPAGAELTAPLAQRPVAAAGAPTRPAGTLPADLYANLLRQARAALAADRYEWAQVALDHARQLPEAFGSKELEELTRAASRAARQARSRALVGERYPMFDVRRARPDAIRRSPDSFLFGALGDATLPARLRDRLNRMVDVPAGQLSVEDLAAWAQRASGARVEIDESAIAKRGNKVSPTFIRGGGQVSLETYLEHALDQFQLVYVEDRDRLLITTPDEVTARQTRVIYPVADIMLPDRVAAFEDLLLAASEQRRLDWEQRVKKKLEQPISLDVRKESVVKALEQFQAISDIPFLIDNVGLSNDLAVADSTVTVRAEDVAAGVVLDRILARQALSYLIHRDAVVIATDDRRVAKPKVRLHSVRGVLTEVQGEVSFAPDIYDSWWRNRWGGYAIMGGGMGGMGGALGGMSLGGMAGSAGGAARTDDVLVRSFGGADDTRPAPPAAALSEETADRPAREGSAERTTERRSDPSIEESILSLIRPIASTSRSSPAIPDKFGSWVPDWDALFDLIRTSRDKKAGWRDEGGIGEFAPSPYTLDVAILGTDRQHTDIESLLERLRGASGILPQNKNVRVAHHPRLSPDELAPPVRHGVAAVHLIDLIQRILAKPQPDWEDNGGENQLEFDFARIQLIVNADPRTHDDLHTMLTLLRRSRYEHLRGARPWKHIRPMLRSDEDDGDLPPAIPRELELLAVRRNVAKTGSVRRVRVHDGETTDVGWTRDGERLAARLNGLTLRIERANATIVHDDLRIVELGAWGESLRELLDAWLPWMPHRSNDELSRRYDITKTREDDRTVTLRFAIPTGPSDAAFEVVYDKSAGAERRIDVFLEGERTARIEIGDISGAAPPIEGKAESRPVAEWFGTGDSPEYLWLPAKPPATSVVASNEPALAAASWVESVPRGFALLDYRPARVSKSRLASAFKAIGDGDTFKAHRLLSQEIADRGPTVATNFLRAWCAEHGVELKGRVDSHEDLRRVAEGDAVAWTRLITAAGFPLLSPGELYDIVRLQPEATRTAEDESRLAQAAVGAHRIPAALDHLERCARIADAESMPLEACSLGVTLALDANDSAAVKRWSRLVARRTTDLEELFDLARRLDEADYREVAVEVLRNALEGLPEEGAAAFRTARRLAKLSAKMDRVRLWIRSLNALPATAAGSESELGQFQDLVRELQLSAEEIETLAGEAKHSAVKHRLLWLQGDASKDPERVAAWTRQVIQSPYRPGSGLAERFERLNQLNQSEAVVSIIEWMLRRDERLDATVTRELGAAYKTLGRLEDALRTR